LCFASFPKPSSGLMILAFA